MSVDKWERAPPWRGQQWHLEQTGKPSKGRGCPQLPWWKHTKEQASDETFDLLTNVSNVGIDKKKNNLIFFMLHQSICLTSFRDGNKSKTESEEHTCSCFLTWSQFEKGRPPSFQSLEAIYTRMKKHQVTLYRSSDGPSWNHPVKTPAKSLISRFNREQAMKLPAWIQWPWLCTTSPD